MRYSGSILFFFFWISHHAISQKSVPNLNEVDVLHYDFHLTLSDDTDEIIGIANIEIDFKKAIKEFSLDLRNQVKDGKGMIVSKVLVGNKEASFDHKNDKLKVHFGGRTSWSGKRTYSIYYTGIPTDGLVISTNKHGDRTFFGDNWPNRAHHWLPCVDHPSDKATIDFKITTPDHYQVVGNGVLIEKTNLDDERTFTHWKEETPIPMKVAVIGAARFAVQQIGDVHGIPISTWVYRQDRKAGFYDYEQAKEILEFFINHFGEYPYQKLANVQSKTRYGGMENASNIFYFENSVTGKREHEDLIAHEIAHQWFGNSASEKNWFHVWLSEGFATYGANLYIEHKYGREKMNERLQTERQRVITYANQKYRPIVDSTVTNLNDLLNPNSYQKASFVLHMLRREIGDENFWKGIRTYYQKYKMGNALTADFQKVIESVSGKNLDKFFQQWIYQAGHPELEVNWSIHKKKHIKLKIKQLKEGTPFDFPVDILGQSAEGKLLKKWTIRISKKETTVILKSKFLVDKIILDPDIKLLFTAKINKN